MGNKNSTTNNTENSPTSETPAPTSASTVPASSSPQNSPTATSLQNAQEISIQDSGGLAEQLSQIFGRSRNSNSTSSNHNNNNNPESGDFSNMLSSLFSSSTSASSRAGRVRIFERNGAYFAYINNRLIQLQAPKMCSYCNKQINPFQEEYELHVVKCMTKPRIKSVTFEITVDQGSELISEDRECMICFEDYKMGDMVSRLECFCVFHKACLENWLSRKQCCPLHMESNAVE